jgi:hypothetical protein
MEKTTLIQVGAQALKDGHLSVFTMMSYAVMLGYLDVSFIGGGKWLIDNEVTGSAFTGTAGEFGAMIARKVLASLPVSARAGFEGMFENGITGKGWN